MVQDSHGSASIYKQRIVWRVDRQQLLIVLGLAGLLAEVATDHALKPTVCSQHSTVLRRRRTSGPAPFSPGFRCSGQLGTRTVPDIDSSGYMSQSELLPCIRIERSVEPERIRSISDITILRLPESTRKGLGWEEILEFLRCPRHILEPGRRRLWLEHMAFSANVHRTSCWEQVGIEGSETWIEGQRPKDLPSMSRCLGIGRSGLLLGPRDKLVAVRWLVVVGDSTVVEW